MFKGGVVMKILETKRLILREWQESDSADIFAFAQSANVMKAGWRVHENIDESFTYIRSAIERQESWAIVLKENNKPIGVIELFDSNRHKGYKELEFIISDDFHNKGYATEAVKCVLDYAFSELELVIVGVCHYLSNAQSKRVIEKCGFTYEGTLRKYSKNLEDSVRYSMTKEEWQYS